MFKFLYSPRYGGFSLSREVVDIYLQRFPGRIIEYAGPSHGALWGGLALAYFLPTPRKGVLQINKTAEEMFQMLQASKAVTVAAAS